jgi:hypothetical protein
MVIVDIWKQKQEIEKLIEENKNNVKKGSSQALFWVKEFNFNSKLLQYKRLENTNSINLIKRFIYNILKGQYCSWIYKWLLQTASNKQIAHLENVVEQYGFESGIKRYTRKLKDTLKHKEKKKKREINKLNGLSKNGSKLNCIKHQDKKDKQQVQNMLEEEERWKHLSEDERRKKHVLPEGIHHPNQIPRHKLLTQEIIDKGTTEDGKISYIIFDKIHTVYSALVGANKRRDRMTGEWSGMKLVRSHTLMDLKEDIKTAVMKERAYINGSLYLESNTPQSEDQLISSFDSDDGIDISQVEDAMNGERFDDDDLNGNIF